MGARPEEIRSEIEETRDRITAEIDELADRYSPGRIAGRTTTGAREAAASMRARVGSGATGMKQRLSLRSSSHHHEHSETCGHLGEGRAGTGQALDVGARQPVAERRGEAQRRPSGGLIRRHRHPEAAPYPATGAAPAPYEPRPDTLAAGARSAYQPGEPLRAAGVVGPGMRGGMASNRAEPAHPRSRETDQIRPEQPLQARDGGAGQRVRGIHKGEAGLAGASLVAAALGFRKMFHQGRSEQDLLAKAATRRRYYQSRPGETLASVGRSASGDSSSGGLMAGLTAAATRAASRRPFTRHETPASSTD